MDANTVHKTFLDPVWTNIAANDAEAAAAVALLSAKVEAQRVAETVPTPKPPAPIDDIDMDEFEEEVEAIEEVYSIALAAAFTEAQAAAATSGGTVNYQAVIDSTRDKASAKGRAKKVKVGAKPGSRLVGGGSDLATAGTRKQ